MHDKKRPAALSFVSSQLARLRLLRQQRSIRDKTQTFAIEGIRQFVQACDAGFAFDTLFVSEALLRHGLAGKLVRRLCPQPGVQRVALTPEQFRSIATLERASGVAAIVRQRWTRLDDAQPGRVGWLVVDHIRSAGNLGTILRTAEACGMSGVLFVEDGCDPYDPAVVRASMGGVFHLQLVRTRPRELGFWLARHEVQTIGLSPCANRPWHALPEGKSFAIALGEERAGLSSPLRRLCDTELCLPMSGHADSLNVAIAAGVMMYELVRARGELAADDRG
jgi:TrmH family RNA methyltransferase